MIIKPVWKKILFELEHPVQCVPVCIVRVALATLVAYERVCYNWPFILCGRAVGTCGYWCPPPPITFGQIKYLYFNKGGGLCPPYKIFDFPTPLCCSQQIVLLKAIESKNPHLFWHISWSYSNHRGRLCPPPLNTSLSLSRFLTFRRPCGVLNKSS